MQPRRMLVVGLILAAKGALFLFGARAVTHTLMASHPVTFDRATRGENGVRRYTSALRIAGFIVALVGAGLAYLGA